MKILNIEIMIFFQKKNATLIWRENNFQNSIFNILISRKIWDIALIFKMCSSFDIYICNPTNYDVVCAYAIEKFQVLKMWSFSQYGQLFTWWMNDLWKCVFFLPESQKKQQKSWTIFTFGSGGGGSCQSKSRGPSFPKSPR